MAKTNKIAPYVKESSGLERQAKGAAPSKANGLYLLELRSRHAHAQSPLPKRKLVVTVDARESSAGASKIKITHT